MTRLEANLQIAEILKNSEFSYLADTFKKAAELYPKQRAGQIITNYFCPDYRSLIVSPETQNIMDKLFSIDFDPFYEESVDTLKRLQASIV